MPGEVKQFQSIRDITSVSLSEQDTDIFPLSKERPQPSWMADTAILLLLTALGLLVHGYHFGLEDEAVYLPAIKHHLDTALYPHDSIFFLMQMKLTFYDSTVAWLIRLSGLRIETFVFLAHLCSLFLVLRGCLLLSRRLFSAPEGQWAGVTLMAALLTLPIAGTALLLIDQYLHPRSFATAFILFALVDVLDRRYIKSAIWLLAAGSISPLMALQGTAFAVFLAYRPGARSPLSALCPAAAVSPDNTPVWNEVTRSYFYLTQWHWYELFGVIAPLLILFSFRYFKPARTLPGFQLVSRRLTYFGLCFAAVSLLLCTPVFERFLAIQPMRAFHLVYLILFLYMGGLFGQLLLKNKPLRWAIFFIPICLTMCFVQRTQFAASDHIEWPGMNSRNLYVQAFEWIRDNTPKNAFFALDPYFMEHDGADFHGFRALAERSMLPDQVKDPAVVSVLCTANKITDDTIINFDEVSRRWHDQAAAVRDWKNFQLGDFRRLKERFGVEYVVLEKPAIEGLTCIYENEAVKVCRID